jgi:tRNA(His) 5'-end guanylyltransferase
MNSTALILTQNVQGCKCAYVQSDEISLLLTDFDTLTTEAWFNYNLQKMVSVSASIATKAFSGQWRRDGVPLFDSRAFNLPKEEVCNYFVWRQQDWTRNSILMLAQAHFSHKELHGKDSRDMHEMLHTKGMNWTDLDDRWKNGNFFSKADNWMMKAAPVFKDNRIEIERYLEDQNKQGGAGKVQVE